MCSNLKYYAYQRSSSSIGGAMPHERRISCRLRSIAAKHLFLWMRCARAARSLECCSSRMVSTSAVTWTTELSVWATSSVKSSIHSSICPSRTLAFPVSCPILDTSSSVFVTLGATSFTSLTVDNACSILGVNVRTF